VNGELRTSIEKGISVLVGFTHTDTENDLDKMARKICNLRIFDNTEKNRNWDLSVKALNYEILCISQFTLYTKLKGNKPDFHCAMSTAQAEQMYDLFVQKVRNNHKPELVKDGLFGLYRDIRLSIDGPVTINMDSSNNDS
jgi:D-tyrosyl-tRNA(Tyr) deacylase